MFKNIPIISFIIIIPTIVQREVIAIERKYNEEYRFLFLFLIHHDNQVGLLFPDHLPEIVCGLVQRMLGSDVTRLAFVILLMQESMVSLICYLQTKAF